ncbi:MAG: TonB-dependent receptor [Brevundimonas sp.]
MAAFGAYSTAHAQTAPAQDPSQDEEEAQEGVTVVDEVVVTGDRRASTLQNFAGTVEVLSGEELSQVGINQLENLNDIAPGLRVQNLNGAINVALRGIGTNQNTELGDPNVASHFDDVYVPRVQGLSNAFFDLQAVEVNFGPQGTLRGRNASSGSLNFITFKPELGNFGGMIDVGYGNFDWFETRAVVNVPVGEDLAFRVSASFQQNDPYYENVGLFPNVEAPYAQENKGVRLQALWQATERLSILLAGDVNDQNTTGFNGSNFSAFLGIDGGLENSADLVSDPRAVLTGPIGEEYRTNHNGIRTRVLYETDGLFNVEYIGSFRDLQFDSEGQGPFSVAFEGFEEEFYTGAEGAERLDNWSQGIGRNSSESTYHEVRFFNDTAPFQYSAGANYFFEKQRTFSSSVSDNNSFFQGQEFNTETESEVWAVYADGTYSVTDDFRITAGIRYTEDRKAREGVISRLFFGGGAANFGCCGYFRLGTPGFAFNTNRTVFDPDINGDDVITEGEQLNFFLDGIASFGSRDTIPLAFANAIAAIQNDPSLISNPNFTYAPGTGCYTSARDPGFVCAPGGQFTYNFLANTINNQAADIATDFVDWRFRLEYDITPDNLVYGLISKGTKAASFNDNLGDLGPVPFFDPEEVVLYEIGSKNEFDVAGRPARFNVSVFYNDYTNQQLTTLLGVQSIAAFVTNPLNGDRIQLNAPADTIDTPQNQVVAFTFNAADSFTYGVQGSSEIYLPFDFKLGFDFLYLVAEVDEGSVSDFRFQSDINSTDAVERSISGKTLPYSPEWQFNMGLAQAIDVQSGPFPGTFDWLVNVSWRDDSFATVFNSEDFRAEEFGGPRAFLDDTIDSYFIWNFAAGYTYGQYRLEGFVNNVFDETVAAGLIVNQFSNTRWYTNPRLMGLRFRVNF